MQATSKRKSTEWWDSIVQQEAAKQPELSKCQLAKSIAINYGFNETYVYKRIVSATVKAPEKMVRHYSPEKYIILFKKFDLNTLLKYKVALEKVLEEKSKEGSKIKEVIELMQKLNVSVTQLKKVHI